MNRNAYIDYRTQFQLIQSSNIKDLTQLLQEICQTSKHFLSYVPVVSREVHGVDFVEVALAHLPADGVHARRLAHLVGRILEGRVGLALLVGLWREPEREDLQSALLRIKNQNLMLHIPLPLEVKWSKFLELGLVRRLNSQFWINLFQKSVICLQNQCKVSVESVKSQC